MNPLLRLLDLIAPDECLGCQAEGPVLCRDCCEAIPGQPAICYCCGRISKNFKPCHNCINKWHPQHVWVYAIYQKQAKDLVKTLKFGQKRAAAKIMARLMDESLPYFADAPLVTYVPTAPARRRERGFDHAELVAKELAKLRGWHTATLLGRQSKVRQLGAKREIRKAQLKGVFRPVNSPLIKNRYVLLIDDVVTTGATVETCSKVLLKAGAAQVDAAVFAYTPKSRS